MEPLLKAQGITKSFPGVLALDGVDFELMAGEVHVLVGENGAGKSTMIKLLSGVYAKDGGQFFMNGQPVVFDSVQRAQALGISTIYQELNLIDSLRKRHPDPLVEINPSTAARLGISDGDWVSVKSPHAKVRLKAKLFDGIAPDVVNAEHAWWYPEAAPPDYRWKESCVNLLFGDSHFDPDSGAEPLKCSMCSVEPESLKPGADGSRLRLPVFPVRFRPPTGHHTL